MDKNILIGLLILANAILWLATIYGIRHERKIIEAEDRFIAWVRKKIRVRRREKAAKWLAKDRLTVIPMFEDGGCEE